MNYCYSFMSKLSTKIKMEGMQLSLSNMGYNNELFISEREEVAEQTIQLLKKTIEQQAAGKETYSF